MGWTHAPIASLTCAFPAPVRQTVRFTHASITDPVCAFSRTHLLLDQPVRFTALVRLTCAFFSIGASDLYVLRTQLYSQFKLCVFHKAADLKMYNNSIESLANFSR